MKNTTEFIRPIMMINVNHKNINHSKLPNKLALLKLPTPVQLLRQNVCRLAEVMIVYFLVGSLFGGGMGDVKCSSFFWRERPRSIIFIHPYLCIFKIKGTYLRSHIFLH